MYYIVSKCKIYLSLSEIFYYQEIINIPVLVTSIAYLLLKLFMDLKRSHTG